MNTTRLPVFDKKIILASQSPRRSELLRAAGFQFDVRTKSVEESYPESLAAEQVAEFLAIKKAKAAQDFLNEADEIVLTADTIVLYEQTLFGKPKDSEEAAHFLRQLSGRMHQVITGVCLLSQQKQDSFSAVSKVYFNILTESEIDYYISNFQPFDKAGAYAIQEWIGLCKIDRIEGTYSNIMGLPMAHLFTALQRF